MLKISSLKLLYENVSPLYNQVTAWWLGRPPRDAELRTPREIGNESGAPRAATQRDGPPACRRSSVAACCMAAAARQRCDGDGRGVGRPGARGHSLLLQTAVSPWTASRTSSRSRRPRPRPLDVLASSLGPLREMAWLAPRPSPIN